MPIRRRWRVPTPLVIGLGPPDLVAGIDVESAHFEQAQRILLTLRPDLTGTKLELAAALVFDRDPLARHIGPNHPVLARCKALAALTPRDLDHHAGSIGARVSKLLAGDVNARQGLEPHGFRTELPARFKAGLHRIVHGGAQVSA